MPQLHIKDKQVKSIASVSSLKTSRSTNTNTSSLKQLFPQQSWFLFVFFLATFSLYILMIKVAPVLDGPIKSFMLVWAGCFLLYFLACIWVLRTKPPTGYGYWIELGLIFVGAIVFRVMLLPLPLGLSRDAWRYLWDGRIMMHGFNPYLYAPLNKALLPIRNSVFHQTPWRDITSTYPPLAEIFFLIGYILSPTKLLGLKALLVFFDLITCFSLTMLLFIKKMDLRRTLIYGWCPLPIVEFAVEGHIDAVAIAFTVLAVLFILSSWRHARIYAGIFLGLATLAKLYPILLLFALIRKRNWELVIACILTILAGFLPFMLTAHGQIFAPFQAFLSQQNLLISVLLDMIRIIGYPHGLSESFTRYIYTAIEGCIMGTAILTTIIQRFRKRMSVEATSLILITLAITLYSHLFPWYAPALLPWIALLIEPLWIKRKSNSKGLAIAACWYLTVATPLSYINALPTYDTQHYWLLYYGLSFGIMLLGFVLAGTFYLIQYSFHRNAIFTNIKRL